VAIAARHPWPQILVSGHGKDDYLGLIKDLVSAAHAGAPLDLPPHFEERSSIRTVSSCFASATRSEAPTRARSHPPAGESPHDRPPHQPRHTGWHARPPQGRRPLPPRASQSRSRTSRPGIWALPVQRRAPIVSRTTPSSLSQGSSYVVIRDTAPPLSQHCGSHGLSAARVESGSQGVGDHAASRARSGRGGALLPRAPRRLHSPGSAEVFMPAWRCRRARPSVSGGSGTGCLISLANVEAQQTAAAAAPAGRDPQSNSHRPPRRGAITPRGIVTSAASGRTLCQKGSRPQMARPDECIGDQGQVRGPAVLAADPHGKQAAPGTEVDRSSRPLMLREKDRGIDGEARSYTIGITMCSPCGASRGAGPGARREVDAPR
jgi:hypothetical protein